MLLSTKAMIVSSSLSVDIFLFNYYIHKTVTAMLTWYTNGMFSIVVLIKVIIEYNELNISIFDRR